MSEVPASGRGARPEELEGAARPSGGHAGPLAAVALLGAFAYSNALRGAFVFDDARNLDIPVIRDPSLLLTAAGYRSVANRFLGVLTLALNQRLGGGDVLGYHAFNVAVHLACALLVYGLVVTLLRTPRVAASRLASSPRAVAFAAAVLFVTHPLQTQAVTYIVQRFTSLATLGYVAAVLLYLRWRQAAGRRAGAVLYAGALLAALAAVRTKEIAFTLPAAILLVERCGWGSGWRLRPVAPFAAVALLIPASLVSFQASAGAALAEASASTHVQTAMSRLDYLRTEAAVVARYLRLLLLPVGQSVDHDFPVYRSFLEPRVAASLALLGALAGLAVALHRSTAARAGRRALDPGARLVALGVGWFFLALLVESSLVPIVDVIYEHRVYLPSVGFFVAIAAGGALLAGRLRGGVDGARLTVLLAMLAALGLAVATLHRNEVWADDVSLWADAAAKAPGKERPVYNLGSALAAAGHPEGAVLALRRAVQLDPGHAAARAQLGAALVALGRLEEAEPELREAVRADASAPEPVFNLAMVLSRTGRGEEARPWFRRFLEVAPASYAGARRLAEARAGR